MYIGQSRIISLFYFSSWLRPTFEEAGKKTKLKNEIGLQEKKIKDKERKAETKQLLELGRLVRKAELDIIDKAPLFGSFLEIKERSQDSFNISKWKDKGLEALKKDEVTDSTALVIIFNPEPSEEAVLYLRERGFKWNRFRKEWYGYGNKQEFGQAIQNDNPKIEII